MPLVLFALNSVTSKKYKFTVILIGLLIIVSLILIAYLFSWDNIFYFSSQGNKSNLVAILLRYRLVLILVKENNGLTQKHASSLLDTSFYLDFRIRVFVKFKKSFNLNVALAESRAFNSSRFASHTELTRTLRYSASLHNFVNLVDSVLLPLPLVGGTVDKA